MAIMPKKTLLTLLTLFIISSGSAIAVERMARIIGGRSADSNAWPWMAGLVYKNSDSANDVFCGASLIAKDWVLTAAHCVIDPNSSDFEVIINRAQLASNGGERVSVDSILLHPLYNDENLENDLALIKLTTPSSTPPINILAPFSSQDNANTVATALGWGVTSNMTSTFPLDLQQVDLPIVDHSRCDKAMGDITDDMLCAGDGLGEKDTCFGDSGGPLIVFDTESNSWRQVGITSWGFDCASPGFFGVYTRLKNYADFISEHICSAQEQPDSSALNLAVNGNLVRASWNAASNAEGYRINYAPYPAAQKIYSIDMNQATDLSIGLPGGSAFYVAITNYNGNCISEYSNIEHFIVK